MTDTPDTKPVQHDIAFENGIKLLEDAFALFSSLNSSHAKALTVGLQGTIMLAQMIYAAYKK